MGAKFGEHAAADGEVRTWRSEGRRGRLRERKRAPRRRHPSARTSLSAGSSGGGEAEVKEGELRAAASHSIID